MSIIHFIKAYPKETPKITMFHNETICVVDSKPSNLEILKIGKWYGIGVATGISVIGFIGFVIRGLFIYFLKYEAPKDRPINTLIFNDQVSYIPKKLHTT